MQLASPKKPAKKKSEPVRAQTIVAPVSQPQELNEPNAPKPVTTAAPAFSVQQPAASSAPEVAEEEKDPSTDETVAKTTPRTTRKFFPRSEAFETAKKSIPAETHKRLSDLLRADFKYLEELGE